LNHTEGGEDCERNTIEEARVKLTVRDSATKSSGNIDLVAGARTRRFPRQKESDKKKNRKQDGIARHISEIGLGEVAFGGETKNIDPRSQSVSRTRQREEEGSVNYYSTISGKKKKKKKKKKKEKTTQKKKKKKKNIINHDSSKWEE